MTTPTKEQLAILRKRARDYQEHDMLDLLDYIDELERKVQKAQQDASAVGEMPDDYYGSTEGE